MKYQIIDSNAWLYPDSVVAPDGAPRISLATCRGARCACQILTEQVAEGAALSWAFEPSPSSAVELRPEVYVLVDVAVEKNTGPVGFVAQQDECATAYTTRAAPFRVYDALAPLTSETRTRGGPAAFYVCWRVPGDCVAGHCTGTLLLRAGPACWQIPVDIEVFAARVPEQGALAVSNWFSVENMATRHGLQLWSEAHWDMIRQYAELMRHARQSHLRVPASLVGITDLGNSAFAFDFSRIERLVRLFFGLGFSCLEGGHVGTRLHWNDATFVLTMDRSKRATSPAGYAFLAQYLGAWRDMLEGNSWLNAAIQYVADEPIDASAQDYRVLAGIVRKFLPGIPLADAVERPHLGGAVDIWVPKNSYYQEHRDEFEAHRALGDTLWFYTCCFPGGSFLNRLLDMPLIRTRLLHWGNYRYDLTGFLHWGLNHYKSEQDPFEENCPAHGEGGTVNLPPGDTHIVYPGPGGPWASVRLEAMGAGAEDYELLRQLEVADKPAADNLVRSCVRAFDDVDEDTRAFTDTRRRLLGAVSALT